MLKGNLKIFRCCSMMPCWAKIINVMGLHCLTFDIYEIYKCIFGLLEMALSSLSAMKSL